MMLDTQGFSQNVSSLRACVSREDHGRVLMADTTNTRYVTQCLGVVNISILVKIQIDVGVA